MPSPGIGAEPRRMCKHSVVGIRELTKALGRVFCLGTDFSYFLAAISLKRKEGLSHNLRQPNTLIRSGKVMVPSFT